MCRRFYTMPKSSNVSPNLYLTRSRGPKGSLEAKRTAVALLPEERAELERLAALDSRTYSAMGRIYLMRGMKADPNYRATDPAQSEG